MLAGPSMTATSSPTILAIGGAHVDRRGRFDGAFVPGASNPGRMREETGGGAFNALRTACRLGASGAIVSMRGGDAAGRLVEAAIAAAGIEDLSATFLDRATPSYTALLDTSGEVIAALADMSLYETGFARHLRRAALRARLTEAGTLLIDANLPAAAVEMVAAGSSGRLYAIAVSPAKVRRLEAALPRLACLFMNRREALALAGRTEWANGRDVVAALQARGLRAGVVTDGPGELLLFEAGRILRLAPPAMETRDVSGAGDALTGATLRQLMAGVPLEVAVRHGVAAAMATVASDSAVAGLTPELLKANLTRIPAALPDEEIGADR